MCASLCTRASVLCLRGGREDKGERSSRGDLDEKKVMGLWGSQNESKNCNNNFLDCCMEEIGGFMNIMRREEPKDDVRLLQE